MSFKKKKKTLKGAHDNSSTSSSTAQQLTAALIQLIQPSVEYNNNNNSSIIQQSHEQQGNLINNNISSSEQDSSAFAAHAEQYVRCFPNGTNTIENRPFETPETVVTILLKIFPPQLILLKIAFSSPKANSAVLVPFLFKFIIGIALNLESTKIIQNFPKTQC